MRFPLPSRVTQQRKPLSATVRCSGPDRYDVGLPDSTAVFRVRQHEAWVESSPGGPRRNVVVIGNHPLERDLRVVEWNGHAVLMDGGEPVKQCKNPKICFLFRSPTRYAAYLKAAGFDVMSLANNHARDFGEEGRSSSMAALDAVGILHSGREGTVASWIANGRRVALVAFAPNVGANSLNDPQIGLPLVSQLAATHDIVIVSFHGGAEGNGAEVLPFAREIFAGEDRGNVVEFARSMVDAGADVVIGHGPHVVRAMELYRDRFIAYSLGNFATYYGISVEGIRGIAPILLLTLDDDGRFVSGQVEATTQIRPAGPTLDPAKTVIELLRTLTSTAFPDGILQIGEDGALKRRAAP